MLRSNLLPYAIVSRRLPAQSYCLRHSNFAEYHQRPDGIGDTPVTEVYDRQQTRSFHDQLDTDKNNVEAAQEGLVHRCI